MGKEIRRLRLDHHHADGSAYGGDCVLAGARVHLDSSPQEPIMKSWAKARRQTGKSGHMNFVSTPNKATLLPQ
jgi:hypothetical protein